MAKPVERQEARARRARGDSIVAIARDLGVARSTVSVWVRDVPRPADAPGVELRAAAPSPHDGRKTCGRCRRDLHLSAFSQLKDGWQHWCRACFKAYQDARRARNREQRVAATARRRARARAQVLAFVGDRGCADCGEADVVVLELDHVRDEKLGHIAQMTYSGASAQRLADELAKCDVVCASCHRLRTATRAGAFRVLGEQCASWPQKSPSQRRAMVYVRDRLEGSGCVDCGERRLACLDFDHVGDKTMAVAELVHAGAADTRLAAEIARCEVRCASCHRRRTEWDRGSWRTHLTAAP